MGQLRAHMPTPLRPGLASQVVLDAVMRIADADLGRVGFAPGGHAVGRIIGSAIGVVALAALAACAAAAQESPYRVGEEVELMIGEGAWQRCTVTDPGSSESVMRLQCEPYASPSRSRAGGVYVASYDSSDVRRVAVEAPGQSRAAASQATPQAAHAVSGYHIGQAVELEASNHWVPCTVSQTDPALRVQCSAYPSLSRAAGEYIVHNETTGLRPATGQTGPVAPVGTGAAQRPAAAAAGTLRPGEYACYGSGGQIMAGLGFKVTGPGRYSDLDGVTSGTFSVSGSNVTFRGGHLGGQTGRELTTNGFRIGNQATCEFWG